MMEKFLEHLYFARRNLSTVGDIIDSLVAWKTFFFLMIASILYQILIVFENLNYAFFVFQILLMVEAVTFFARGGIMIYHQIDGWLIYILLALSIVISAVSPFAAYYPFLTVGKWPLWVFSYFAVGYPLAYLLLTYFAWQNLDIYYNRAIGWTLCITFFVIGLLTFFYALVYGAYMHYCHVPFLTREIITSIVYFVQSDKVAGVERIFQIVLLVNAACISNYNYGNKLGIYI